MQVPNQMKKSIKTIMKFITIDFKGLNQQDLAFWHTFVSSLVKFLISKLDIFSNSQAGFSKAEVLNLLGVVDPLRAIVPGAVPYIVKGWSLDKMTIHIQSNLSYVLQKNEDLNEDAALSQAQADSSFTHLP